jgi:hypothetical protein
VHTFLSDKIELLFSCLCMGERLFLQLKLAALENISIKEACVKKNIIDTKELLCVYSNDVKKLRSCFIK